MDPRNSFLDILLFDIILLMNNSKSLIFSRISFHQLFLGVCWGHMSWTSVGTICAVNCLQLLLNGNIHRHKHISHVSQIFRHDRADTWRQSQWSALPPSPSLCPLWRVIFAETVDSYDEVWIHQCCCCIAFSHHALSVTFTTLECLLSLVT